MNFNEYQREIKNMIKPTMTLGLCHIGLSGEVGEVNEIYKKAMRDNNGINYKDMEEELGDVLYYLGQLCNKYGLNLDEVAYKNIIKVNSKYEVKF